MWYHTTEMVYILIYWATVCKTVRPMLSYCCLSVCNVGVLWPNGCMDQDETWHAGRSRPWPHCVRWEPTHPQFLAHVYFGQMVAHLSYC